jgi:hypothetical protein
MSDKALPAIFPVFKQIRNLKKRTFLAAFCRVGAIEKASRKAKVHWSSHYRWLESDQTYAQAFELARGIVGDRIEGSMIDSALNGDKKFVTFEGEVTDSFKQKPDIVRIFMLKGFKPQYRDNFSINQFSGPVQVNVKFSANAPDPLDPLAQTRVIDGDDE